jgi:hypothetical protein
VEFLTEMPRYAQQALTFSSYSANAHAPYDQMSFVVLRLTLPRQPKAYHPNPNPPYQTARSTPIKIKSK